MTSSQPSILAVDPEVTVSRAQVEILVAQYADAMTRADADAIAALFAENATRTDPVGSHPNHGREQIRDAVRRALPGSPAHVRFRVGAVHGSGNVFAFTFEHTVISDGSSRTLRGIDVFALTTNGLIGYAAAYWGADDRN